MTLSSFILVLIGVLLNAAAQLLLKAGTNTMGVISPNASNWASLAVQIGTEPRFLAGFACYGISVVIWILALSRVPVSVAYPLLSMGYIVNAIAAYYFFGEAMNASRWLGMGFIIAGVYLMAKS